MHISPRARQLRRRRSINSASPRQTRFFVLTAAALLLSVITLGLVSQRLLPITRTASAAPSTDIVISQIYGGSGNAGGIYKNDFIELFNRGSAPVTITGWSVQYRFTRLSGGEVKRADRRRIIAA